MQPTFEDRVLLPQRFRWIYGIPIDFWVTNRAIVGEFIRNRELEYIDRRHLGYDDPVPVVSIVSGAPETAREAEMVRWPRPFPGGLRSPHLHFEGELYALDREQWKELSEIVVEQLRTKLDRAETVGFDSLMDLSSAIDSL